MRNMMNLVTSVSLAETMRQRGGIRALAVFVGQPVPVAQQLRRGDELDFRHAVVKRRGGSAPFEEML